MFTTRSERVSMGIGNLFFLTAIALFVFLILMTIGTVRAEHVLEPPVEIMKKGVK